MAEYNKAKQIVVSGVDDDFKHAVDRYCADHEVGIADLARTVIAREIGFDLSHGRAIAQASGMIKRADSATLEALKRMIAEAEAAE